ncbi:hypothetical protein HFO55_34110 [Rhizobium leguminosarum]|nr:hypothetical protein [Rhizobium leguminosarum]MBY5578748.1 hypothetical protein [Rhizobium leguminosarum]
MLGQPSLSIAEILRTRQIPFIFSTGYGMDGLPDEFGNHPVIAKPFSSGELQQIIAGAIER